MAGNNNGNIIQNVSEYYSTKLQEHGVSPAGVDWNGQEGQFLRFEQLCKVIGECDDFTISDIGCGYGALVDYLNSKYKKFSYLGLDISETMVFAARGKFAGQKNCKFLVEPSPSQQTEFSMASGIFNVRLGHSEQEWLAYIKETISKMNTNSSKGFAFNCLTSYSDKEKMRDNLYYADPLELFDFCKKNFSKNVALLHDYGLYEFTMIVRK